MKRLIALMFVIAALFSGSVFAQGKTVSGKVVDTKGEALFAVNIGVKGTSTGTTSDMEGNYKITAPEGSTHLVFTYVGYINKEVEIGSQTMIDVTLESNDLQLEEVVVTALGIEREKKALGYAVQEVGGEALSEVRETNLMNSLSGKVSGVQIRSSGMMGGSSNVIIRGSSSLTGNNQAMFVVDGVPIDNSNSNGATQAAGGGGYDYGNAAQDINPDDIATMTVLKGAAATALYGSRAANGVIMITTKKGSKRKGLGISVNSGLTFSKVNKQTLPEHQKEYGAGYDQYFDEADVDGDGTVDEIVPIYDDASWGHKFDPNRKVVQWTAMDPNASNFGEKTPWVAGANGIDKFFETGIARTNNVSFSGGNDNTVFRLSYTNLHQKDILPNSSMDRNTVSLNTSSKLTEKLTASVNANFVTNKVVGRPGTGYDAKNVMQSFGQWFETNIDVLELKNYLMVDGSQNTWNKSAWDDATPAYFDNPYWVRYKNYQNDSRNRIYGNIKLDYALTSWLTATGRVTTDYYAQTEEERTAKGGVDVAEYTKTLREVNENNYDLILNFNKKLNDNITLTGLAGGNMRTQSNAMTFAGTRSGLSIPDLYTLANSVSNELQKAETLQRRKVNGIYANASLGYKGMLYLDLAARNDWSSTLPLNNNSFLYPSVSTGFVFSELSPLANSSVVSFGKIRASLAQVANDGDVYQTANTYTLLANYNGQHQYSVPNTLANAKLLPEISTSSELGIEMLFLKKRAGFDFAVYNKVSRNQILPLTTSLATGYSFNYINAGSIQNKGVEVSLNGSPIAIENGFKWEIAVNWARNRNKVVELLEGVSNYQLASMSGGITINATVGEPYGTIRGTNFVYADGHAGDPAFRLLDDKGYYKQSAAESIGSAQPKWNGGITNTFSYKGFSLSALLDMQKGGSIYSLNTLYGRATGVYAETAGNNDLGNPMRDAVTTDAKSGGIALPGVFANGNSNTGTDAKRVPVAYGGAFHWTNNPAAMYVFDASYVKLREVNISYNLPKSIIGKTPFSKITISAVGRNLAILQKNTRHFDPETSLGSGNIQGYESGAYPRPRNIGFNVNFGL